MDDHQLTGREASVREIVAERRAQLVALLDTCHRRQFSTAGLSAMRCLLGFVGLMFYVSNYTSRHYLFGNAGVVPWAVFVQQLRDSSTFSLYALSGSSWWFEMVFHLGMLSAALVFLGIGGRVNLFAHWVLLWSLYQRDPFILDGGDNLAYIVLIFLLLTRCFAFFTVGPAVRSRLRLPARTAAAGPVGTALHNLGLCLIAGQILLVYSVSGLYKVQGRMWQDGTALYYILHVPEFSLPGVSEHIAGNAILVPLMTWGATMLLVLFPALVAVRWLRTPAALAIMAFHLSIAVLMGLTGFALTMMACDMIFLDQLLRRSRSVVARWALEPSTPPLPAPLASTAGPVMEPATTLRGASR